MTFKLHMNGVITGSLNCFCLACDVFLKSPNDATHHIRTSEHQKNADAVQFSDKFPDEHIKKFKGGYYCEFCNVLMPIASKVNVHITEDEHKHNKGILSLKPMGLDVVAFNNVLIEEKAWHGLIDGVCSLCNAEFVDENDHKADAGHSLNLVLKPIQFGVDNTILRHLDDTTVQCLSCNKLLAPGRMSKHFDGTEHLELYAKRRIETNRACQGIEAKENCQEKATNMTSELKNDGMKNPKTDNNVNIKNKGVDKNNIEKSPIIDKSKILEAITKYQTKGININLETETAFCKKCSEVVTFGFIEIENHIENHSSATVVHSDLLYPSNVYQNLNRVDINDKTSQSSDDQQIDEANNSLKALRVNVLKDSSTNEANSTCPVGHLNSPTENLEIGIQEEEVIDYAKANKITYNNNNNQSFCRVCEVHVSASFKSMKEHVEGTHHRSSVASCKPPITQPEPPAKLSKQKTIKFLESIYDINFYYIANMINEKYCIHWHSLYLILVSENNSRMSCLICEVILPPYSNVEDHLQTKLHGVKWLETPVITSEKNEFIREVRPGLYHCGFCHLLVSGWTEMKRHLECSDHHKHRTTWENRLRYHMPEIQRFKMQNSQEDNALKRLLNVFKSQSI